MYTYKSTRRHNPEHQDRHIPCRNNPKSHIKRILFEYYQEKATYVHYNE